MKENDAESQRLRRLSLRELEISRLVAEGLTNKEIGARLFISPITVRHHLTSIFNKLEIRSRFELIVICYRHELVVPPVKKRTFVDETREDAAS